MSLSCISILWLGNKYRLAWVLLPSGAALEFNKWVYGHGKLRSAETLKQRHPQKNMNDRMFEIKLYLLYFYKY